MGIAISTLNTTDGGKMEDLKETLLRIAAFVTCVVIVVGMSVAAMNPVELVPSTRTFYGVNEPIVK